MEWPEAVLHECWNRLVRVYNEVLVDKSAPLDQGSVRFVLVASLHFGAETALAVSNEINSGRVVHAAILCRPLYELAAQVCWASREHQGLEALAASWWNQEICWLKTAKRMDPWKGQVEDYLRHAETEYARIGCHRQIPAIQRLLAILGEQDGLSGKNARQFGEFYYTVYRMFSMFEHGNVFMVGAGVKKSTVAQNAVMLLVYCTHLLVVSPIPFLETVVEKSSERVALEATSTMELIKRCTIDAFRGFDLTA